MSKWFLFILIWCAAAAPLAAQSSAAPAPVQPDATNTEERLRELHDRIDQLSAELHASQGRNEAEKLLYTRSLKLFGEVGIRYHGVFTDGASRNALLGGNEINRPEYRLSLGITGFLIDNSKHRFQYGLRLSTVGLGEFDAPHGAPTVGFRPFDPFGSGGTVTFDRWWMHHTYKNYLRVGGGAFGSIFEGTQLIFDEDLALPGIFSIFDIGGAFGLYPRHSLDDIATLREGGGVITSLQLRAAFHYLAQNNLGLDVPVATSLPHGASVQAIIKARIARTDTSLLVAPGLHLFEGEEAIIANIGTGNTFATSNATDTLGAVASEFRVADLYIQATIFEERVASLNLYAHLARNLGADSAQATKEREGDAMLLGVQWGALRLDRREMGDFRIGYRYSWVEADATLPQFNDDWLNTNFKGHTLSLHAQVFSELTFFASMQMGTRVEADIMGIGRRKDGNVGSPSNDHETRYRAGFVLRF